MLSIFEVGVGQVGGGNLAGHNFGETLQVSLLFAQNAFVQVGACVRNAIKGEGFGALGTRADFGDARRGQSILVLN